jgi:hypothetical protein
LFSASSISMILLNKAVMRVYPLPSVLLVMQVGALKCRDGRGKDLGRLCLGSRV